MLSCPTAIAKCNGKLCNSLSQLPFPSIKELPLCFSRLAHSSWWSHHRTAIPSPLNKPILLEKYLTEFVYSQHSKDIKRIIAVIIGVVKGQKGLLSLSCCYTKDKGFELGPKGKVKFGQAEKRVV